MAKLGIGVDVDSVEEHFDLVRIDEFLERRKKMNDQERRKLRRRITRQREVLAFERAVRESGGPLPPPELERRVRGLRRELEKSTLAAQVQWAAELRELHLAA